MPVLTVVHVVCDDPCEHGRGHPAGEGRVQGELGPLRPRHAAPSGHAPARGQPEPLPGEGPAEVEAHGRHPAEHGGGRVVQGVAEGEAGRTGKVERELGAGGPGGQTWRKEEKKSSGTVGS